MLKNIRDNLRKLIVRENKNTFPAITERSTLLEIETLYPNTLQFFRERYQLDFTSAQKKTQLSQIVKRLSIPAQILYMEIQLFHQTQKAREISATSAKKMFDTDPNLIVLDVRETWERDVANLPKAIPLTEEVLLSELPGWEKSRQILVYCHFGIRSVDAALFLMSEGFENVFVLKGGIDAWSQQIDASVRRYEQAWC